MTSPIKEIIEDIEKPSLVAIASFSFMDAWYIGIIVINLALTVVLAKRWPVSRRQTAFILTMTSMSMTLLPVFFGTIMLGSGGAGAAQITPIYYIFSMVTCFFVAVLGFDAEYSWPAPPLEDIETTISRMSTKYRADPAVIKRILDSEPPGQAVYVEQYIDNELDMASSTSGSRTVKFRRIIVDMLRQRYNTTLDNLYNIEDGGGGDQIEN